MSTFEVLTDELIARLEENRTREADHYVYHMDPGTVILFDVHKDTQLHVMRAFMTAGTDFPLHIHKHSIEHMLLYSGAASLRREDGSVVELSRKYCVSVGEGEGHSVYAETNCWILATLIPPDAEMFKPE